MAGGGSRTPCVIAPSATGLEGTEHARCRHRGGRSTARLAMGMVAVRDPKPFLETPTAVAQIVIQAPAQTEPNHDHVALFESALSVQMADDSSRPLPCTPKPSISTRMQPTPTSIAALYASTCAFSIWRFNTMTRLSPSNLDPRHTTAAETSTSGRGRPDGL